MVCSVRGASWACVGLNFGADLAFAAGVRGFGAASGVTGMVGALLGGPFGAGR